MKNLKKETTALFIGIISIVLLAGGLSLAYFLMRVNGTPLPFSARTARTGTITIDGGTGFNSSPIVPGYIDTNDVTLTATASDTDMAANINLIYTNTLPDLQYKIEVKSISVNGSTVGFSEYVINDLSADSFTNVGTAAEETTKTLATVKIKASEHPIVIVYTVTLTLPSSAGNTNQGGVFSARIGGASVDPSSIEDKYNFVEKLLADHSEMLTTTNTEDASTVRYFSGSTANNWVVTSAAPNTIDVPICDDKEYVAYAWDDNFNTLYNRGAFSALSECNSYSEDGYYLDHCEEKYTDECTDTRDLYHYWRIVRTNTNLEEGGVRLIYSGSGALNNGAVMEASNAYINVVNRAYSYKTVDSPTFNYGDETGIINAVNTWYASNIQSINSLVNTKAIYCSDNTINGYNGVFENYTTLDYVTKSRITSSAPSLKCGADENAVVVDANNATASKYTVDSSTGNGNLVKPIAFLTADEAALAGNGTSWLYYNINNAAAAYFYDESNVTTHNTFYLMSYYTINRVDSDYGIYYYYYGSAGLSNNGNYDITPLLRPVISLKSNVSVTGGNGSAVSPYIIKTN